MNHPRRAILRIASASALAACAIPLVRAQNAAFPSRVIRIVVPLATGGSADAMCRLVAAGMSKVLGQTVIVDNKPGAGGLTGMAEVARAPKDGYTLGYSLAGALTVANHIAAKMPYDPATDFAPVTQVVAVPEVVVVNPKVEAKTLQQFIALAKANPGKLNFASAGNGSASHLFGELFRISAGIDMVHVPYKGGGAAMPDLLSGQVSLMLETIPNALPQVRGGKLNGLAVTSLKRSSAAPDIPTVSESGLPGFDASSWTGLSAPAGTPKAIISVLNAETVRITKDAAYLETLKTMGTEAISSTPEGFDAFTRKDIAKWTEVVKKANIQPD